MIAISQTIDRIFAMAARNNGLVTGRELGVAGIPRVYLDRLAASGRLRRVQPGLFAIPQVMPDEFAEIQHRCPKAVFSHDTALYLHGLSDGTPLRFTVTLPTSDNSAHLRDVPNLEIRKCIPSLFGLGAGRVLTPEGFSVFCYDIERTICDVIRRRKRMDYALIVDAVRRYARSPGRDPIRLLAYARRLRIEKAVRIYFEVL